MHVKQYRSFRWDTCATVSEGRVSEGTSKISTNPFKRVFEYGVPLVRSKHFERFRRGQSELFICYAYLRCRFCIGEFSYSNEIVWTTPTIVECFNLPAVFFGHLYTAFASRLHLFEVIVRPSSVLVNRIT